MRMSEVESPRVLIRNGKMTEASDVVDMLSLEEDPVARAETTVRTRSPGRYLHGRRDSNTPCHCSA